MRIRNLAIFAGSLMLAASASVAQDVANYKAASYNAPDTEEVIVTAPDIRMERNPVFGLPSKASLSRNVAYHDLDLRTTSDARTLRQRVREAARDVCVTLKEATQLREASGTSCVRDAMNDAMPRADRAIREARYSARDH